MSASLKSMLPAAPPALPRPPAHPLLPFPDEEAIARLARRPDGADLYLAAYRGHQKTIAEAQWDEAQPLATDPFEHGFKLPHWQQARWLLGLLPERTPAAWDAITELWARAPYVQTFGAPMFEAITTLPAELRELLFYIWIGLGGNRATKSEMCAWLTVESLKRIPGTTTFCVAETLETSRKTQQGLIWKYLPLELKKLNDKSDPRRVYKISYNIANGFGLAAPRLVLPNGSQIVFTTYNQEPSKQLEGVTLGSKLGRAVGMWLDESATTGWFDAGRRRCQFSGAVMFWSFTPVKGMTPAIREAVGEARTVVSFPAELLGQEQRHVNDCPRGHMPYLALPRTAGAIVHYFPAQFNPFSTHAGTYYQAVINDCTNADGQRKAAEYVKRIAYGYTEDVSGRAFPGFSARHVVTLAQIPEKLALYHFTDPHGKKPYASIWVGVTPGGPEECTYYILRDFPDEQRFGEWAVATTRQTNENTMRGWDGDPGPAARPLGWGIATYKREWRALEKIHVPGGAPGGRTPPDEMQAWLRAHIPQPWRRPIVSRALRRGPTDDLREEPLCRYMDARFCNSEAAGDDETVVTLAERFAEEHHGADGATLPSMFIQGITGHGKTIVDGLPLVNDLLDWNKEEEFIPHINAPRLYVWEGCKQVRWMFENYTAQGGEEGACKEFADLARHLAKAAPLYAEPEMFKTVKVGGSYG